MNWKGKVKEVTVVQRSVFCNPVYQVELENGKSFDFPMDRAVKQGHSYNFYRDSIFYGINSLEEFNTAPEGE